MARTAASSRARARATNSSSVWTSALVRWTGVKAIGNVLNYHVIRCGLEQKVPRIRVNAIRDCCRSEMSTLGQKRTCATEQRQRRYEPEGLCSLKISAQHC